MRVLNRGECVSQTQDKKVYPYCLCECTCCEGLGSEDGGHDFNKFKGSSVQRWYGKVLAMYVGMLLGTLIILEIVSTTWLWLEFLLVLPICFLHFCL